MGLLEELARQEKTDENIEQIIIQCNKLVHSQLHKFYMIDDPDAYSFAYEALYKAIITYNTVGSTKFITYATVCIYNRLGSYLRTIKNKQPCSSLDSPITEDGSFLIDVVDSEVYTDKDVINRAYLQVCTDIIDKTIASMPNRTHAVILQAWKDSNYEASHTMLAKQTGVSQSYVSQVIAMLRGTLKRKLEGIEYGKSISNTRAATNNKRLK